MLGKFHTSWSLRYFDLVGKRIGRKSVFKSQLDLLPATGSYTKLPNLFALEFFSSINEKIIVLTSQGGLRKLNKKIYVICLGQCLST